MLSVALLGATEAACLATATRLARIAPTRKTFRSLVETSPATDTVNAPALLLTTDYDSVTDCEHPSDNLWCEKMVKRPESVLIMSRRRRRTRWRGSGWPGWEWGYWTGTQDELSYQRPALYYADALSNAGLPVGRLACRTSRRKFGGAIFECLSSLIRQTFSFHSSI